MHLNLDDRRVFLYWRGCKVWIAEVGAKRSFLTAQDGGQWSSHYLYGKVFPRLKLSSAELTGTAGDEALEQSRSEA